ncbi:MAG: 5-(carboxyamino)imidazole ribonucleotide synthase [Actinomycetota bacterium]|nr:5-(carboxyamino)imidazole ribonucleotide synthase [Actinomycetota bacterium]
MDARTGLPVVGVVGAGQLARMMQQAAISLGQSVRVLADSAEDGAALVTAEVMVGDYRSLIDLRAFAAGCDVVTFDHEHVPNEHIAALAADGVAVFPGAAALRFAQDKSAMRAELAALGLPSPRWIDLSTDADPAGALRSFGAEVGWPVVLKAARGGYDGKGVWVVDTLAAATEQLAAAGNTPLLAEEKVAIVRELAADIARSPFGQGAAWPVVQTVQVDGICVEVVAPAPSLSEDLADEAQQIALRLAGELGVVGVLAVELFEVAEPDARALPGYSGRLLVNELAMRPHNSAHWTIEGSRTSQFEQHLRAVLDYPLGTSTPTADVVVMANLLAGPDDVVPKGIDERLHHCMARWPDVKIHLYGKAFRPGRKVGHVTALGTELEAVRGRARAAADYLANGADRG